jgi:peptidoglycan/LPS O-acetylase OafA/YrhL
MGCLRFILASIVLFNHASRLLPPEAGTVAVETFYLISGFYMQLIVGEYAVTGSGWIGRFYASRLMRLVPLYYVVLLATSPFVLLAEQHAHTGRMFCRGHTDALAICVTTNLFIVGQDALRFSVFDPQTGMFHFSVPHRIKGLIQGDSFSLLGQSWSLALELPFYFLVPFLLLRPTGVLIAITAASLMLKLGIATSDLPKFNSSWNYAFFPAQLGIFLAGALVCRYVKNKEMKGNSRLPWFPVLLVAVFLYIALETLCSIIRYGDFIFVGITALLLPFIFDATRRVRLDRRVGEYSYPLYMLHFLVIYLFPTRV